MKYDVTIRSFRVDHPGNDHTSSQRTSAIVFRDTANQNGDDIQLQTGRALVDDSQFAPEDCAWQNGVPELPGRLTARQPPI